MKALLLCDIVFSGTQKWSSKIFKLSSNLMINFASVGLHSQTTGDLLWGSILIRMYSLPVTCLLCSLLEESIFISCPVSVNIGSLIVLHDGKYYFKIIPELKHALHLPHVVSLSFIILDHQKMLLCAGIFVEQGCPKRSASSNCFFNSWQEEQLKQSCQRQRINRSVR